MNPQDKQLVGRRFDQQAGEGYSAECERDKDWRGDLLTERVLEKTGLTQGVVLDLGCADGFSSKPFFAHPNFVVTGVDLSPQMIECAAQTYPFAQLLCQDLDTPLIFADQTFDLVISFGVLEFVDSLPLREVARVLKGGGYFAFTVEELDPQHPVQCIRQTQLSADQPYYVNRYSRDEILQLLQSHGFTPLERQEHLYAYTCSILKQPIYYLFFLAQKGTW